MKLSNKDAHDLGEFESHRFLEESGGLFFKIKNQINFLPNEKTNDFEQ